MEHDEKKVAPAYTKPEVKDYGDLRELTAQLTSGSHTDVPLGAPVTPNIFSN